MYMYTTASDGFLISPDGFPPRCRNALEFFPPDLRAFKDLARVPAPDEVTKSVI